MSNLRFSSALALIIMALFQICLCGCATQKKTPGETFDQLEKAKREYFNPGEISFGNAKDLSDPDPGAAIKLYIKAKNDLENFIIRAEGQKGSDLDVKQAGRDIKEIDLGVVYCKIRLWLQNVNNRFDSICNSVKADESLLNRYKSECEEKLNAANSLNVSKYFSSEAVGLASEIRKFRESLEGCSLKACVEQSQVKYSEGLNFFKRNQYADAVREFQLVQPCAKELFNDAQQKINIANTKMKLPRTRTGPKPGSGPAEHAPSSEQPIPSPPQTTPPQSASVPAQPPAPPVPPPVTVSNCIELSHDGRKGTDWKAQLSMATGGRKKYSICIKNRGELEVLVPAGYEVKGVEFRGLKKFADDPMEYKRYMNRNADGDLDIVVSRDTGPGTCSVIMHLYPPGRAPQ